MNRDRARDDGWHAILARRVSEGLQARGPSLTLRATLMMRLHAGIKRLDSRPRRADDRSFANEIEAREIAVQIGVALIEKRLLLARTDSAAG
jgi:hypothetical protein